jgi:two-component system NarL family response regulator
MQGYVTKNGTLDELLTAIRAVHEGHTYLPAALAAALAAQPATADLSPRELEVLRLVAQGLSNKQIAYALHIAEHTAKNHVKNVLDKLGTHDRTEAAVAAIQRGIIHFSLSPG